MVPSGWPRGYSRSPAALAAAAADPPVPEPFPLPEASSQRMLRPPCHPAWGRALSVLLWLNQPVHDSELQGAWWFRLCSPLEPGFRVAPGTEQDLCLAQITNPMPTRQGLFLNMLGCFPLQGILTRRKSGVTPPQIMVRAERGQGDRIRRLLTIHQHCFRVGASKLGE